MNGNKINKLFDCITLWTMNKPLILTNKHIKMHLKIGMPERSQTLDKKIVCVTLTFTSAHTYTTLLPQHTHTYTHTHTHTHTHTLKKLTNKQA